MLPRLRLARSDEAIQVKPVDRSEAIKNRGE